MQLTAVYQKVAEGYIAFVEELQSRSADLGGRDLASFTAIGAPPARSAAVDSL